MRDIKDLTIKKKNILEDANVNLKNLLELFDAILQKDDYLILEDSDKKQKIISFFLQKKKLKYQLDQFFINFFDRNITRTKDSIFMCF